MKAIPFIIVITVCFGCNSKKDSTAKRKDFGHKEHKGPQRSQRSVFVPPSWTL